MNWRTKEGREVPVVCLSDRHLGNIIRLLRRAPNPRNMGIYLYDGDGYDPAIEDVMADSYGRDLDLYLHAKRWLPILEEELAKRGTTTLEQNT
jgi:hypothetical protein